VRELLHDQRAELSDKVFRALKIGIRIVFHLSVNFLVDLRLTRRHLFNQNQYLLRIRIVLSAVVSEGHNAKKLDQSREIESLLVEIVR